MINNKSKKFTIIKKSRICKSMFCKAFGLMFRTKKPDHGLIFVFDREVRADIHMLFVFFPIDVLFLDKNQRVVDIKKSFKQFTYYKPKAKAKYVVELPVGRLNDTLIGDKILFN